MNDMWLSQEFLNANNASKQGTFLQKFIETGMFSYFIEQRVQQSAYESYYQFFDSCF